MWLSAARLEEGAGNVPKARALLEQGRLKNPKNDVRGGGAGEGWGQGAWGRGGRALRPRPGEGQGEGAVKVGEKHKPCKTSLTHQ